MNNQRVNRTARGGFLLNIETILERCCSQSILLVTLAARYP